ncbi:probable WRKY transcription factor protein 1 isoform X5 [Anastrepha ludens]|uniref:probable WRKY transcription factor protein 1 isoform X5 n=1 Tax=Anastrepha ludens TaxID=28586 RepID=UPI0023B0CD74|nr:probable WRKY transcription factor protein 1 isoform X5 [Anastrepha ludens]
MCLSSTPFLQVTPDGLADKGGIRLGDILLEINEEDATELSLTQAHEKIEASGKKIHFLVKNMEEDPDFELGEEKSIVLRVPKTAPPPKVKSAASIEARLREMQRKLSEIAEIPKILSSTLATVSQTFEKLKPADLQQQQCQQHRKHSYDEDALDYELSGAATQQRLKLKAKGKVMAETATTLRGMKMSLAKDTTPESDYASEGNYESNEADTDDDYGDSEVDGESRNIKKGNDTCEANAEEAEQHEEFDKNVCKYALALTGIGIADEGKTEGGSYSYVTRLRPSKSSQGQQQQQQQQQQRRHQYQHLCDNVKASAGAGVVDVVSMPITQDEESEEGSEDYDVVDEDSDEDILTARLVAADSDSDDETGADAVDDNYEGEDDGDRDEDDDDDNDFLTATYTWNLSKIPKLQLNDEKQSFDDESNSVKNLIDIVETDDTDEDKPNKKARWCHADDESQHEKHAQWSEEEGEKEKKFTEKLERSWPWADRERIIYKQSTCHLVRRRPLGLVEQRIKLLAKQNLGDSLERQLH